MAHLNVLGHAYGLGLVRNSYLFVDFFFVLSGFVISSSYSVRLNNGASMAAFIIRRFGRLWPLHIAILSLFVSVETLKLLLYTHGFHVGSLPFQGSQSAGSLPANFFLIQSLGLVNNLTWNMPSWSISTEFYVYIIYATIMIVFHKNKYLSSSLFLFASIVSIIIIIGHSPTGMDITFDFGIFRCLLGFLCGVGIFSFFKYFTFDFGRCATACEFGVILITTTFVNFAGRTKYSLLAPFVFSVVVLVYAKQEGKISKWLSVSLIQKFGAWSYSIYMIHLFIIINVINRPMRIIEKIANIPLYTENRLDQSMNLGHDVKGLVCLGSAYQADLLTIVYIIIVIFISSQTYRFIEVPCRDYINLLTLKKPKTVDSRT
jgi:peptidoglycan/LPS O-acetylase OafA/YrhL